MGDRRLRIAIAVLAVAGLAVAGVPHVRPLRRPAAVLHRRRVVRARPDLGPVEAARPPGRAARARRLRADPRFALRARRRGRFAGAVLALSGFGFSLYLTVRRGVRDRGDLRVVRHERGPDYGARGAHVPARAQSLTDEREGLAGSTPSDEPDDLPADGSAGPPSPLLQRLPALMSALAALCALARADRLADRHTGARAVRFGTCRRCTSTPRSRLTALAGGARPARLDGRVAGPLRGRRVSRRSRSPSAS